MKINKKLKRSALVSANAVFLTIASGAHAYDFEVGNTTASVYGYAKLDMIYDVDAKLGNSVGHGNIILDDGNGSEGHADFHAKQSRIGFKTSTPLAGSTLNTTIEGDFYGSGNDTIRLRHAFGEWGGILAGQTWSNFGNFVGMNPTIDFTGQVGQPVISRQAQLRYTTGGFSVALEDPSTLGSGVSTVDRANLNPQGEFNSFGDNKSSLPDLTAQYRDSAGNFSYAASAVLRQLEYYNSARDSENDSTGWGVSLAGSLEVSPALTVRGSITHGDGIGGYLYVNPGVPAYVNPTSGDVETVEATGGTAGLSLAAGPGNINLGYGISTADLEDAVSDNALSVGSNEKFESIFLNYIWSPVERVSYGIEAGYHSRENQNGDDGDAVRLQGMVQYSF